MFEREELKKKNRNGKEIFLCQTQDEEIPWFFIKV